MSYPVSFRYDSEDQLYCENLPLKSLAEKCGTPLYVYSKSRLIEKYQALVDHLKAREISRFSISFAVKSCSNIHILRVFGSLGCGADVVSIGEIQRCLKAGINPRSIVFSGVGKTIDEIDNALALGVRSLHVESLSELRQIYDLCRSTQGRSADICLRVNPEIESPTHKKIATGSSENKFGIHQNDLKSCLDLIRASGNQLRLCGIACHIGSQIRDLWPFESAVEKMQSMAKRLISDGFSLKYIDFGGGFGIDYHGDGKEFDLDGYAEILKKASDQMPEMEFMLEPGRWLVADCGGLLTKVLRQKKQGSKHFVIVDAAMTELLRPTLYEAHHRVLPVNNHEQNPAKLPVDIVGPVCESGDFLAKDANMPALKDQELILILDTGAYGASMASQYNSRPLCPEILVHKNSYAIVRRRQTVEDLMQWEL